MIRPTIRLRLTAWYASMFFVGGAALLAASYVLVSRSVSSFPEKVAVELERRLARDGSSPLIAPAPVGEGGAREVEGPVAGPFQREFERVDRVRRDVEADVRADTRRTTLLWFGSLLGSLTLVSLGSGWLVAGRVLRPVSRITATARRVSQGRLDERLALAGPRDELHELADTFDEMLERLDAAFTSQRRFVANASHELRTPLAVMRTELEERLGDPRAGEDELRAMAAVVSEALRRSENLIESLLLLARSHDGVVERGPVDLAERTAQALDLLGVLASRHRVAVERRLAPAVAVADAGLLDRLIGNLVENGIRHNVAGGFIRVATGVDDGEVWLRVANSGLGVPGQRVPDLFEPFSRLDRSRSRGDGGAGLGLAIVAEVAKALGADLRAVAHDAGGLDVRVAFPRAACST